MPFGGEQGMEQEKEAKVEPSTPSKVPIDIINLKILYPNTKYAVCVIICASATDLAKMMVRRGGCAQLASRSVHFDSGGNYTLVLNIRYLSLLHIQ